MDKSNFYWILQFHVECVGLISPKRVTVLISLVFQLSEQILDSLERTTFRSTSTHIKSEPSESVPSKAKLP
jgi:hypothetical protein